MEDGKEKKYQKIGFGEMLRGHRTAIPFILHNAKKPISTVQPGLI